MKTTWFILLLITMTVVGGMVGGLVAVNLSTGAEAEAGDDLPLPIADAVDRAIPAVVGVSSVTITRDAFYRPVPLRGVGSGVIVHADGYIITNDHVVSDAHEIVVIDRNGDRHEAEVLWSGPDLDLAIIRIDGADLPVAAIGDSDGLRVGQQVLAIGNPLGLAFQRSVTAGIVSAVGRAILIPGADGERIMEDLIQTDASINPGNSGGPLINLDGEVVGINTAKVTGAEGLGFSIPINLVRPILTGVVATGTFVRPYLGVMVVDSKTAALAQTNLEVEQGAVVVDVVAGGPAYDARIRPGDVIIAIDGDAVNAIADIRRVLLHRSVGDVVDVRIIRDGQESSVSVRLAEMPALSGVR